MQLTEQVGKRNVLRAGWGRGGVGAWARGHVQACFSRPPRPPGCGYESILGWTGKGQKQAHTQDILQTRPGS